MSFPNLNDFLNLKIFVIQEDGVDNDDPPPGVRPCGVLSTGAILLADTIPGLLITFISPFLPFWAK